jgi:uridine kinase
MKSHILVGIAGGSGSGKTVASQNLAPLFPSNEVAIISQDSYYKDRSDLGIEERAAINYDHPDSFDFDLMKQQLITFLDGDTIEIPIYDFATHTRMRETETVHSVPIVIVEGLMILGVEFLRKLMDLKVYVDVPADIRFIRRLKRDIEERDRDVKSVVHQYLETVRPMHEQFVEKTKNYADIIITDGGNNQTAINLIQEKIQLLLTA